MKLSISFTIELSRDSKTSSISFTSWKRLRKLVKKRDRAVCRYCGVLDELGTVDHITPLSNGGTDAIDNLVWCCKGCNSSKGAKSLDAWGGRFSSQGAVNAIGAKSDALPITKPPPETPVTPALAVTENIQDVLESARATGDTKIIIREGDRRRSPRVVTLRDLWGFLTLSFERDSWGRNAWQDRRVSQSMWKDYFDFLNPLGFWRIDTDDALACALDQLCYPTENEGETT